jgi:hypothetical protein
MVYTHLLMLLFGKLFRQIKDGWVLVKESIKIVQTYPVLIVPLFVTWIFMALCVLIVRYTNTSSIVTLAAFFAVIYSLVLSCLLLLELMQQIETGSKLSLTQAIGGVIGKNALKAVPIALVWAVLWFILLLLTPKKRKEDTQASLNDAAATLSGANSPFGLGLELLKKLLRMFFFLTLPAIAWEGKGPIGGFKRAFIVVKKHPVQFLSTYALTLAAATLMALPLIPYYFVLEAEIVLPNWVLIVVIIYSAIVWTTEIYLEQMSLGLLYLWHLKWEKSGTIGNIESIDKPSLLDNVHELTPTPGQFNKPDNI